MRNTLYGKKCAEVMAKEPDVFVGLFSLQPQHQYDKEQHKNLSLLQPSKYTYTHFQHSQAMTFLGTWSASILFSCLYISVSTAKFFARQNSKRKTRRLDNAECSLTGYTGLLVSLQMFFNGTSVSMAKFH